MTSGATSEQVVGVEVDMSDRAATTVQAIGNRVRELRTDRSLTLQAMADMTGLSPSLLSLVERGKTSPSIGTLVSVAHALGVHMSDLVPGESAAREEPVIRASDQREFATNAGVTRRVLRDDRVRGVEIAINQYAPEGRSADRELHHGGFEYGFVLEGELCIDVDGTSYSLSPGDSIGYDSNRPHRIVNRSNETARALWVNLDRS
ncbi:MAG: cupin domain-containing protein [Acidimicrobiia bacterium]|nr:cupin domain-containing protein [Acidimicrobiia bacterium]MDH5293303.1 cupin domain-containing protein [Acidimicrobiia bacterium]